MPHTKVQFSFMVIYSQIIKHTQWLAAVSCGPVILRLGGAGLGLGLGLGLTGKLGRACVDAWVGA